MRKSVFRVPLFTGLLLGLIISNPVHSKTVLADPAAQSKINYAVMPLKNGDGVSAGEASLITDRLRIEIFQTHKVNIMERDQMQDVLQEQGLQNSGACNDDACLVQMGQLLGVERMVTGSLGRLGTTMFMLNLRVIDVSTGQLLSVESADIRGQIEDVVSFLPGISKKIVGMSSEPTTPAVIAPVAPPIPTAVVTPEVPPVPTPVSNDKPANSEPSAPWLTHIGFGWSNGMLTLDPDLFQDEGGSSAIFLMQPHFYARIQKYFHFELGLIISHFNFKPQGAGGPVSYNLNNTIGPPLSNGNLRLDGVKNSDPGIYFMMGPSIDLTTWLALHFAVGMQFHPFVIDVNMDLPDLDVSAITNPYGEDSHTAELLALRLQLEFFQNAVLSLLFYGTYNISLDGELEYTSGYNEWKRRFINSEPEPFTDFNFAGGEFGAALRWNWR
jgi:hypothetical protein